MVAEGNDVGAGGEDLLTLRGRYPDDIGIFSVDDGEIDMIGLLHGAQTAAEKVQTGPAADVAHREDPDRHGIRLTSGFGMKDIKIV